ncbi:hypothetical protein [Chitinophaga nivalis]|uniref:EF-hand domain-containing protein n=1 Tax=Chitinophaga nivalis TaxID=2991709 RepID=A0ABT3IKK8_9BACT|nr:hypothetical protein [Chitinophaga nivalis]MCW3465828.1 hypothetical protein [Chitinophaga nivalis]MCW3484481.1 hypothetical protein [Chitinophaga nivalis]
MNNIYIKKEGESAAGEWGTFYFEFADNYITKQIEIYPSKVICLDENNPEEGAHILGDQPLHQLDFDSSDSITAEEFYQIWNKK